MRNVELYSTPDHIVGAFHVPLTQLILDDVVVPLKLVLFL